MKPARIAVAAALALGTWFASGAASADPGPDRTELTGARARFDEGLALAAAGDWSGALAAFQDVAKVKQTPQVRFHVARAEDHLGFWVRALGHYRLVVVESASVAGTDEAKKASLEAIARLEKDLPRVRVEIIDAPANVEILLDGHALGPAGPGAPILVDPGPHRFEARSGGVAVATTMTAVAKGTATVELRFGSPKAASIEKTANAPASVSPSRPGAIALFATAGVATSVGVVALVVRQNAIGELDDGGCRQGHCPTALASVGQRGEIANAFAVGGFITGGAAFAGAVVWLANGRPAKPPALGAVTFGPASLGAGRSLGARASLPF